MCGIAGKASRNSIHVHELDAAVAASAHRGPDAKGARVWSGPGASWALGHTRLAINDLSSDANQPMTNEDDTLVMVFNGEIYNSPELRRYCEDRGHRFRTRSDCEPILHLWEMEGPACLARLNGIFAFAMASTTTGEVFLARDPFGVKPLSYVEHDGELWFASELAGLRALDAPVGGHDVAALAQFLTFLWIPDPATPHTGARTLEPGAVLRWDHGESSITAAPSMFGVEPRDLTLTEARDEAAVLVQSAVQRQLLSDVSVGVMASGGIDSSLIWWAAGEALDRAFTIDWIGDVAAEASGEMGAEDTRAVRALEQRLGTPVEYVPGPDAEIDVLPASGDLLADPAYHLTRMIARSARDHGFKVLLSGQGADELFGGYRRHLVAPMLGRVGLGRVGAAGARLLALGSKRHLGTEYTARILRATSQQDPFRRLMELCSYSTASERARALDCTEAEVSDDVVWARHRAIYDRIPAGWSSLKRALVLDLGVYLPGCGLAYSDRAGMEFGVEIRVPWLDLDLVRWSLSLPDHCLIRGRTGKRVSRALTDAVLGPEIAGRPKHGFGVPTIRLQQHDPGSVGDRGFRQGAYFAHAQHLLALYRNDDTTPTVL